MREKTFRVPTVKDIFDINGINMPENLNEHSILKLIASGSLIPAGQTYHNLVSNLEDLATKRGILLIPPRFYIHKPESDEGIKSLGLLMKIDSQPVLRSASGQEKVPTRVTQEFAQKYELTPEKLIKNALNLADPENPPFGFYWAGPEDTLRATTWIRCATGAEMAVMHSRGDFVGNVKDSKNYGRNIRVSVSSRTNPEKEYEFSLYRLPMFRSQDNQFYSEWTSVSHNSSDPDTSYRGGEHDKRKNPVCFWSAPTIFAFYTAMKFIHKSHLPQQFRANPFPIPLDERAIEFIDNLRLRTLCLHLDNPGEQKEKYSLFVTPKIVMDGILGARTVIEGYDKVWFNWGKRDTSYLYTPR